MDQNQNFDRPKGISLSKVLTVKVQSGESFREAASLHNHNVRLN